MPPLKDHYKTLGVGENAGPDEIKKAYRKLARAHHPDTNQGDRKSEERFKEIQEAYEVLSDAGQRRKYDRARKHPFGNAYGEAFATDAGSRFYRDPDGTYRRVNPGRGPSDESPLGGLGDLFGRFFGEGAQETRASSARPKAEVEVHLSFSEALSGGTAEVKLPNGRTIRVPYPRGVRNRYKVRLKGKGDERGRDQYVLFRVASHPDFKREGNDVLTRVEINIFEAVLGVERSIATPYGQTIKLPIPKGTQPGEHLRLRGQGIRTEEGNGDLLVEISVKVPKDLTKYEEEALRQAGENAGLL